MVSSIFLGCQELLPIHFNDRYFTIAHEIAHNLVQPHNSEHEFYFSAICERYLAQLARLIGSSPKALDTSKK